MKEMLMWDKYDNKYRTVVDIEDVKELQAELDKKDEIISLMAERLEEYAEMSYSKFDSCIEHYSKQEYIDYFTKKVR